MADDTLRAAHHATYVLRQPDGGEIVIVVADDEAALDLAGKVIGSAPLLPGEDPALLPGPDRVVRYPVIHAVEQGEARPELSPGWSTAEGARPRNRGAPRATPDHAYRPALDHALGGTGAKLAISGV